MYRLFSWIKWSTTSFLLSHHQSNAILKEKRGVERKGGNKYLVEDRAVPSSAYFEFCLRTEKKFFISSFHFYVSIFRVQITSEIWDLFKLETLIWRKIQWWRPESETHGVVVKWLTSCRPLLLLPGRFPILKSELRVCFRILLNTVLLHGHSQLNLQSGGTSLPPGFECSKSGSYTWAGIRNPWKTCSNTGTGPHSLWFNSPGGGWGGIDVLLMLLDGENTLRTTILDFRTTINRQQLSFPL